jgi:hypothetical protein
MAAVRLGVLQRTEDVRPHAESGSEPTWAQSTRDLPDDGGRYSRCWQSSSAAGLNGMEEVRGSNPLKLHPCVLSALLGHVLTDRGAAAPAIIGCPGPIAQFW